MEILKFENVDVEFEGNKVLKALNFSMKDGETLGIMGESGSGKSTICNLLVGLLKPKKGRIIFDGKDMGKIPKKERKEFFSKIQIVFQDSANAVNPRFKIVEILKEPLLFHPELNYENWDDVIFEFLNKVQLDRDVLNKYPNELSGGQLQRICIIRSLLLKPKLLLLDESVSGLDPLVQDEIIKLLVELKKSQDLSYLFISHNFEPCYAFCDRVKIIEKGKIVEVLDINKKFEVNTEIGKKLLGNCFEYISN